MNYLTWKVYNPAGEHVASLKHAEDAAALVAFLGKDATIRAHRTVLWTEGGENQRSAAESYDAAAALVEDRLARLERGGAL